MKAKDFVTAPIRGVLRLLRNPLFQVGAVLGVSIGLKNTVDTYKDFEAAMSQVSAVSGATGSELDKLTQKAKEMGSTTKFTAKEAAEGFNYMAMAGWKTNDMLDGIEGILSLAAASGEDLGTTSDIVTDALTAFGLQAKDSTHFADVLAQASSNANTNVSMLGESFKYVAPVAGAMKYSVEDVSLALGLMANASVKSSMAGTSLKTAIANMSAPTKKMKSAMDKYKISLTDGKGQMKSFKEVLDNIRGSLGKLSEAEQAAATKNIFGKEAMSGMLAIVNASEKDYNKLAKAINNADGAAADMAATMLDNLEGSITILNSALDGVKLSFGKRLSPYLKGLAEWLTDQMPEIEQALEELMDSVDRKVGRMQAKFDELTKTDKWQNADFFGKVKIAWDEFIAEPFVDWWNTTGKLRFAEIAKDVGHGIGSGLKFGIMTLLGIDLGDTTNEAVSVGASFAKGFAEGFDFEAVSSKLWDGFKNILGNASKLLPGGESADLSSWLSMALLAKIAKPIIGFGLGTGKVGKVIGTGLGSLLGTTGNQMMQGTGLLNLLANAGYALTGGSATAGGYFGAGTAMSGGAAAAVGAAGVAGTVAAGASLISGAMDFYKAAKSDDVEGSKTYGASGALKGGGIIAGAIAGATIGSAVPVIGTALGGLVGAGVGGVAGYFAGNKVKESYEKEFEEAQKETEEAQKAAEKAREIYKATGIDIDNVKFKSKELNKAIKDTEVSAEEFTQMYQEKVAKNLEKHFGNVSLSLKEIKKLADDVVFANQATKLNNYAVAAEKATASFSVLENSMIDLRKANWRVGLGLKLDTSEKDSYKTTIESYVQNAKDYVNNQHYEAKMALELTLGKKGSAGIIKDVDKTYTGLESQLDKLGEKLTKKVEKSLEDGVISAKEEKAIRALQKKIQNVTSKISDAEKQASLDALKIKYGNEKMDASSFASFQEELEADNATAAQEYFDAMQSSLVALRTSGLDPNSKKYKKREKKIEDAYYNNMSSLSDRSLTPQLDMIVSSYSDELDNILPELEGTTQQRLKEAMSKAFAIEPDAVKWEINDVIEWFGLESLEGELQGEIFQMLQSTAQTVKDSEKAKMSRDFKDIIPSVEEIMEKVDFSKMTWSDYAKFAKDDDSFQIPNNPIQASKSVLAAGLSEEEIKEQTKTLSEHIHKYLQQDMNPKEIQDFMTEYMNSAVSDIDTSTAETVKNAGSKTGDNLIDGVTESIIKSSDEIRKAVDDTVIDATSAPFTVDITIAPNVKVKSYDYSPLFEGGNSKSSSSSQTVVGPSPSPKYNAAGGYAAHKQLSWLAEEGYGEYIIPTNPSRRGRALELYEQAGRALGVGQHAAGGFVGRDYTTANLGAYSKENATALNFIKENKSNVPVGYNEVTEGYYPEDTPNYSSGNTERENNKAVTPNVSVTVQMNPEFNINGSEGQSEEQVVEVIKRHIGEIADEVGGEIADVLRELFSNMPLKGA
ncbi:MAG: phage tail tape measure protein [Lachnospiraceae bacterium]|nr:phage tail tape measure protein [Lachnospiraceae bacterium]